MRTCLKKQREKCSTKSFTRFKKKIKKTVKNLEKKNRRVMDFIGRKKIRVAISRSRIRYPLVQYYFTVFKLGKGVGLYFAPSFELLFFLLLKR